MSNLIDQLIINNPYEEPKNIGYIIEKQNHLN